MFYEAVLLFGVYFAAAYPYMAITQTTWDATGAKRLLMQGYLFVVFGAYFVYCWTRSGQTLAQKTWGIRLVDRSGRPPRLPTAVLRYLLAWPIALTGLGFIWSFFDRDGQFLHDRLLDTRLIAAP